MRDLERTPLLSQDVVVLSEKVQSYIRRLAKELRPNADKIKRRWRKELPRVFGEAVDGPRLRALAAINPASCAEMLAEGRLSEYMEHVEYHGRRLAKLDVPPNQVLASLKVYEEALLPDLKRQFPDEYADYVSALDHLYFCVKLTLNNAYYQVRDLEAHAFYDVLHDQLQSLSVHDLLHRVLETLMRTFRAQGGVIVLKQPKSRRLAAKAWHGVSKELAESFNATLGKGLSGRIASRGEPMIVVDVPNDPAVKNRAIREAFRSLWGIPLSIAGRVTGVLHLGFTREYHCLPREMKLLETIAERCAYAIDKAQLLEELHEREEQIRHLGEHMLTVEEEERRRISRELHDEVGQSLLVIRLYLEMIQNDLPDSAKHLAKKLEETRRLAEQTIREMRRLISDLSPSVLEELGLPASVRHFINTFSRTFPGKVRLSMADIEDLPKSTEIMLYRLVQGCFSNVIKHSQARNVSVWLGRKNGVVQLNIKDDGVGFSLEEAGKKRESFGLAGMRERVVLLGGDIDIQSSPGKGARVRISIPV